MTLTIRPATSDDLGSIVSLWVELAEFHVPLGPGFELAPNAGELFQAKMAESLERSEGHILVAEDEGGVIGFMSGAVRETAPVFANRTIGYISNGAVAAAHRRKGVGESLYRELVKWFRSQDVGTIELSAARANTAARSFWSKMGFEDHMVSMRGRIK